MRIRHIKKAAAGGGGGGGISDAPSDGSKYARRDAGWVVVTDGYLDGEVATYADLPVTVGTPAVDSAYLVRTASGLWLVARKSAGVYIRTGNAGALSDWTYAGTFPDAFSDDNFEVYDGADSSKLLGFSLGGITTGTKRTATWPDKSGTVAFTSDLVNPIECWTIALGDETTAITTGLKRTFRVPYAFTITEVRASVTTAPTGSTIIFNAKESGTTIFSTKPSIDVSETTTTTAAVPPVVSDASLADGAEITLEIDQIGSTIAGAGPKFYIIGRRT